jgi:hypothetical protein
VVFQPLNVPTIELQSDGFHMPMLFTDTAENQYLPLTLPRGVRISYGPSLVPA